MRSLFDREAPRWDDRYAAGGSMRARVQRFLTAVATLAEPGARVLDFGCGAGHIARALGGAGYRVAGVDVSPRMLAEAAARDETASAWIRIDPGPGVQLPFADARFDVVVSSSVFEYLEDPVWHFAELRRVLRPGGWALVSVPDDHHRGRVTERRLASLARMPLVGRLLRRSRWRDYVDYLRLSVNRFPLEVWEGLAREAGLEPDPCQRVGDALLLIRARRRPGARRAEQAP